MSSLLCPQLSKEVEELVIGESGKAGKVRVETGSRCRKQGQQVGGNVHRLMGAQEGIRW